jgi:cytochrome c oxidase subunit 2
MSRLAGNDGMFDPDSSAAADIVLLWWVLLGLGTVAFGVFAFALMMALLRRRSAPGEDEREPNPASLRRLVVSGGVVLPTIVLTAVLVATVATMRSTAETAPDDALHVEVVAHQWWWEIRYPEWGIVSANELHLPVDRPVALSLHSADVIHSFWVPALGGKIDLLPDRANLMVLEPTETGEHHTQCAEFCGLQHALMRLMVIVQPQPEFDAWLAHNAGDAQAATDTRFEQARRLFVEADCASCHTVRGTDADGRVGPDLTHVASRQMIGAGTSTWSRADVRAWIADPHDTKPGIDMPASTLGDDELETIVEYLMELR